jgi:hypothetical protein
MLAGAVLYSRRRRLTPRLTRAVENVEESSQCYKADTRVGTGGCNRSITTARAKISVVSNITVDKYLPYPARRLRFSKNFWSASTCLAEWKTTCLASFIVTYWGPTAQPRPYCAVPSKLGASVKKVRNCDQVSQGRRGTCSSYIRPVSFSRY